jgi:hypothetical protein
MRFPSRRKFHHNRVDQAVLCAIYSFEIVSVDSQSQPRCKRGYLPLGSIQRVREAADMLAPGHQSLHISIWCGCMVVGFDMVVLRQVRVHERKQRTTNNVYNADLLLFNGDATHSNGLATSEEQQEASRARCGFTAFAFILRIVSCGFRIADSNLVGWLTPLMSFLSPLVFRAPPMAERS